MNDEYCIEDAVKLIERLGVCVLPIDQAIAMDLLNSYRKPMSCVFVEDNYPAKPQLIYMEKTIENEIAIVPISVFSADRRFLPEHIKYLNAEGQMTHVPLHEFFTVPTLTDKDFEKTLKRVYFSDLLEDSSMSSSIGFQLPLVTNNKNDWADDALCMQPNRSYFFRASSSAPDTVVLVVYRNISTDSPSLRRIRLEVFCDQINHELYFKTVDNPDQKHVHARTMLERWSPVSESTLISLQEGSKCLSFPDALSLIEKYGGKEALLTSARGIPIDENRAQLIYENVNRPESPSSLPHNSYSFVLNKEEIFLIRLTPSGVSLRRVEFHESEYDNKHYVFKCGSQEAFVSVEEIFSGTPVNSSFFDNSQLEIPSIKTLKKISPSLPIISAVSVERARAALEINTYFIFPTGDSESEFVLATRAVRGIQERNIQFLYDDLIEELYVQFVEETQDEDTPRIALAENVLAPFKPIAGIKVSFDECVESMEEQGIGMIRGTDGHPFDNVNHATQLLYPASFPKNSFFFCKVKGDKPSEEKVFLVKKLEQKERRVESYRVDLIKRAVDDGMLIYFHSPKVFGIQTPLLDLDKLMSGPLGFNSKHFPLTHEDIFKEQ